MSADEILAANLWPWPDPLLKRGPSGHVIFVNAAFLQLYGGQIDNWRGQIVSGWPAPVRGGAQRFETRVGTAPDESVFDWVENAMPDGGALAIARNVTIFMAPPVIAAPPVITAPLVNAAPQQETAPQGMQQPTEAPQQTVVETQSAPDLSSELEATQMKRAEDYANSDNMASQAQTTPPAPQAIETAPPIADQLVAESQIQASPAKNELSIAENPISLESSNQSPKLLPREDETPRMIERRALPIKDSEAVLGSNWRDQVIAKAVGNENAENTATGADASAAGSSTDEHDLDLETEDIATKFGAGLKILLAEDNAINALLTRTLLEADGAEVDTVEDGALALQAVGDKQYDLIFMDMRMPNMDGLESTRKIRAFGSTMPIIALTANAFDDDRNACFDSGMNDFMTKPVSAEELSEMVINWTQKEGEAQKMTG